MNAMLRLVIMILSVFFVCFSSAQSKHSILLREANDMSMLPENTPATHFFKYSFYRIDDSDVRSLAFVMKDEYAKFCKELGGCDMAENELVDLYTRRYNELRINMHKMTKLGLLFQRLIGASRD